MLRPAYIATLLTACLAAPAMAQHYADVSDAELAARFSVNGVRIASGNRIALVNDQLFRVGENVGDAQIIAIESNAVHLRVANRSFAMRVGSSLIRESRYVNERLAHEVPTESDVEISVDVDVEVDVESEPVIAAAPINENESAETAVANAAALTSYEPNVSSEPPFEPDVPGFAVSQDTYGPIAPGETLSEIAASLAHDRINVESLMAALYEHNPEAFGDSMDLLYAGTRLLVPDIAPLPAHSRATERLAAASPRAPPAPADDSASRPAFVTVHAGDTLSEIAEDLAIKDITLNQAMLAIYAANPASFGGNLNLLYAGEILRIPDAGAWRGHDAEDAIAEVARHVALWQHQDLRANST